MGPPAVSSDVKIAAVVPARAGSKRVRGKNVRSLGGKPLWQWATDAASCATYIDEVWVSTDHPQIVSEWKGPMHWRADASDEQTSEEWLRDWLEHSRCNADIIVVVQPTSPFRTAEDIDAVVGAMAFSNRKSALAVDGDGKACGAVYAVQRSWFVRTGAIVSGDVVTVRVAYPSTLDIDTEEDWREAERLAGGR